MIEKKYYTCLMICMIICNIVYAQELYKQTAVQQHQSSLPMEALRIDLSKPPSEWILPTPSNYSSRQTNNDWYPVKGEVYGMGSETEPVGYIYHEIGQNRLLDKKIIVANQPNHSTLYDSTCSVMNRTPYTKGKDLLDTTYNYTKKTDGSYQLKQRITYSYHYFDHFEADSFYYETIYHTWDDVNHQWTNWFRQKTGYHDTLVEFLDRTSQYYGVGDTWKRDFEFYDSITYDHLGFVDTLYMIRQIGNGNRLPTFKAGFTYNEQGHYTKIDFFAKNDNTWDKVDEHSNILWTEWNGFTYSSYKSAVAEIVSPYKRSKIESYNIDSQNFGKLFYQKWWDVNGIKTNKDTTYSVIEGKIYPGSTWEHIYNEYGDYVEWRNAGFSNPDENGDQKMIFYSAWYHKYVYDEIYGMTESMMYQILLNDHGTIDTTFNDGFKYTEFAPVDVSIAEHPQTKQSLHIYPNPASGTVTIYASAEIAQLTIFDITGRMVSSQSPASGKVVFDTGVLPKGIYLVQARLADGRVQTGKVVVR